MFKNLAFCGGFKLLNLLIANQDGIGIKIFSCSWASYSDRRTSSIVNEA